jgi:hypothetical protein
MLRAPAHQSRYSWHAGSPSREYQPKPDIVRANRIAALVIEGTLIGAMPSPLLIHILAGHDGPATDDALREPAEQVSAALILAGQSREQASIGAAPPEAPS